MDNNNSQTGLPNQDPVPSNPPKRPKLHSPILQGDDVNDDAYADQNFGAPKPSKNKKTGNHLRSPLLGGDDFDDEVESQEVLRAPKGSAKPAGKPSHLRSPLLGGSADDEDDYEEDFPLRDKSPFPHRSRTHLTDAPEPPAGSQTGSRPHLRSPLLQGDDEYDEPPVTRGGGRQPAQAPAPRSGKLHSPLFDSSKSSASSYEYEEEEETTYEETNNKNVLRSPLLAAKVPLPQHEDVKPAPAAPKMQTTPPAMPQVQPPAPPRPMNAQPPQLGQSMAPLQPVNPMGAPLPNMLADPMIIQTPHPAAPPAPAANPAPVDADPFAWRDRGFPNAAPSAGTGFGTTSAPGPSPVLNTPVSLPPLPNQQGFAPDTSKGFAPPAPVETKAKEEPKLRTTGRSKLLPSSSEPDMHVSGKQYGEEPHYGSPAPHAEKSGPIMVLLIPVLLVTIGKAWFLFTLASANQLTQSIPMMVDQFGQFILMVAILIFAMNGNKR